MKKHKIAIFVIIFAIFANIAVQEHDSAYLKSHIMAKHKLHYCQNVDETEHISFIRMLTPRLRYLYFEDLLEIVHERKPDIPENYFCIIVEEKNRVQEARRNVDENTESNKCSKKC